MSAELVLWIVFGVVVVGMLALDLGVFHRHSHTVKLKEALVWSAVWISLALLFNLGVWIQEGSDPALRFLTAYLIEKSLSVDNIFVFILIFTYFNVPRQYHHKVLFWGILGALIMRAILIGAGITLLDHFHFLIYIFGGFLIFTGLRLAREKDKEIHPERNPVIKVFRKVMPVTQDYEGDKFFITRNAKRFATPLFIVLLAVETTDLVFAIDSIPAVLAITDDPFIVYTSNVFAILGLRALYFALAGVMGMFSYLHYGLAAVLVWVGTKMLLTDVYKVPIGISLGVIAGVLLVSIAASLVAARRRYESPSGEPVAPLAADGIDPPRA